MSWTVANCSWRAKIPQGRLRGVDISGWGCYVFRMSAPGAERFTCDWIFKILVVLSDGKVVCGCADPYGERPLGALARTPIREIWNSEKVREIREGLNRGYAPFCLPCGLKRPVPAGGRIEQRPVVLQRLPRIFLEPTVLCNLSCDRAVCSQESGIVRTRSRPSFPLAEYAALIDEIGPDLVRLDLFNYGDPFVHPQAVEMIEDLKRKFPSVYLYTSTNGLLLTEEKIVRIIEAGLDEITFSVDGPDQKTYSRYRRGGDFEKVMRIMGDFVRRRDATGREVPFVNWRYILFRWNDSWRKMIKTRRLAYRVGVDRLTWEITDHPPDADSLRYRPGTRGWRRVCHEIWDTSQIGSAIAGRRYAASLSVGNHRTPIRAKTGGPAIAMVRVRNTGGALWRDRSYSGRRLVRLGAQLFDEDRKLVDLNFARAFLPRPLQGGESERIGIELPALEAPGDFWLKFDMVSEGIDWFESGGSPVAWSRFRVE